MSYNCPHWHCSSKGHLKLVLFKCCLSNFLPLRVHCLWIVLVTCLEDIIIVSLDSKDTGFQRWICSCLSLWYQLPTTFVCNVLFAFWGWTWDQNREFLKGWKHIGQMMDAYCCFVHKLMHCKWWKGWLNEHAKPRYWHPCECCEGDCFSKQLLGIIPK